MYPSSSSSSSSSSSTAAMGSSTGGSGGSLTRYGSAPSSLLATVAESITRDFSSLGPSRFFHSEPSTHESNNTKPNLNEGVPRREDQHGKPSTGFDLHHRPYGGFPNGGGGASSSASASLVRQSSSPAGFLNHLASTVGGDNGFSITRGIGSYNSEGIADHSSRNTRLSFTETQNNVAAVGTDNVQRRSGQSYTNAGFALGSWDDTNTTLFTVGSSKRSKNIVNDLDAMESEFQFGIPAAELEMQAMENLLHIPQDSVPCKIRAKRGCATHPRSIAERERRTRISGKLKKLQDLVPNMDKQTSYADMLDLAVQHIKCLQNQVEKLNDELENCTCGCKKSTTTENS